MRLPKFEYLEPRDIDEALEMLTIHGSKAKILAGGTDLLVRMKHRLVQPKFLISLKSIKSLSLITPDKDSIRIGAGTSLADLCSSPMIKKEFQALDQAASSVGSPSIQHHRGTIGGNICQENRCQYYNQSDFCRSAKQPCHKDGGKICYAREGADRCNSTTQSDTAPALIALGATITLVNKNGQRTIPLVDLYTSDGS